MKKTLMILVLVAATVTAVFANGARDSVTVEGKLAFVESLPTITSGGKTWILPAGPFYQIAYENNIKAGDTIKAEGFGMECEDEDVTIKDAWSLMPTKVTVNGKAIDLTTFEGRGMMGGRGGRGGMMGGRGSDDGRGMMDGRGYDDNGRGGRGNNR